MVSNRLVLKRTDPVLYAALWRRRLLDATFAGLERSDLLEAVGQITLAVKEF
ncbi:MAG: hypothetical protein U0R44_02060 [Candidatus Micrarchaeia archaeon]